MRPTAHVRGAPRAAEVRVLAVSRIAPAERAAVDPVVKLSFFDAQWVALPPIRRVFLYLLSGGGDDFSAAVARLKSSLAATLAVYLPLAGKLAHVADTGDVVVDCADDPGVAFVEAVADGAGMETMDVRRLAGDEAHDITAFLPLVPELPTKMLPAPVLSVQATRIPGGLALGLSLHHAVADGKAMLRFMGAWASAAREGSPVTKSLSAPHYSRQAVHIPNGDELTRQTLKMVAPNLPVVTPHLHGASAVADCDSGSFSQRFRLVPRTFYLAGDDIRALKRRIDALDAVEDDDVDSSNSTTTKKKPVSTFVALAALGWTSFVRSKGLAAGDDTYLVFPADLRARLDPPVGDGYLGNCIMSCVATADAGDLQGERGLLGGCRAILAAVAKMEAAPLAGTERSLEKMKDLPFTRVANVVASPRFRVYEASDFGFGRAARVELVSMNRDVLMEFVGGRADDEVQLSVSLDPASMDEFKAHVLASGSAPKEAN